MAPGRSVPPVAPYHWKLEFDPLFPPDTWVSLVVYCRHPAAGYNDVGQDCVTVYAKGRVIEKARLAAARMRKKAKKKRKVR